jgi:rSAM/selenodomain-associated transferase 2/rSAM/selenodomain-associated transferase 1
VELEIRFDGASENAMRHWLGDGWCCRPQCEGDLGQRMERAFDESFREGATATVIIGSDCPTLTPESLASAFESLEKYPAVIGPAADGGYYLIGLTRLVPGLFHDVAWGTESVFARSMQILERTGTKHALLEMLNDVDRPDDLPAWQRITNLEEADLRRMSIIIPALDEAGRIATTIAAARAGEPHEILLVDGGSTDDTVQCARDAGATVANSAPGRARQMNAGAALATGSVLLFLHADTQLPRDYVTAASSALQPPAVAAGAFRFRVDADFAGRRIVEWTTNLRSRWGQMPYGDQAIFVRRPVFEEVGGFADLPIMEDYDLARRLSRRGRIVTIRQAVTTSARRWCRLGALRTTLINQMILAGFLLRVSPHRLARLYRREESSTHDQ